MKIEEGKYYRTSDGRKVGPMKGFSFKWVKGMDGDEDPTWQNDGKGIAGAPDLIAEWVDNYYVYDRSQFNESRRPWEDFTDEEKGAFLLAEYNGGRVERFCEFHRKWVDDSLKCGDHYAYRIKPEPVRETKEVFWNGRVFCLHMYDNRTHRITFDLVDGQPDTSSVKMEKL